MKKKYYTILVLIYSIAFFSCGEKQEDEIAYYNLKKKNTIEHFINDEDEIILFSFIIAMRQIGENYIFLDKVKQSAYKTDRDFNESEPLNFFGQGPGEVQSMGNFSNLNLSKDEFIISDIQTNKLQFYSRNGDFKREIKLSETNIWHNKIYYEEDFILFGEIPPQLATAPKIIKIDLSGNIQNQIELNFSNEVTGHELSIFKLQDVFLSISMNNSSSYAVFTKDGKILNKGSLSGHEIIEKNEKIAKDILERYKPINVSVALFSDIYVDQDRLFILVNEILEDQSHTANKVFELNLVDNNLVIKKIYQLDENESYYLSILVDENKLLASNKRTGFIDEYTLPN